MIQSPVRREMTSAWAHQRGHQTKSWEGHRTMVGARNPATHSGRVANRGPTVTLFYAWSSSTRAVARGFVQGREGVGLRTAAVM